MNILSRMRFLSGIIALVFLLVSNTVFADKAFTVVTTIKPVHSILAGLMEGTEGPELLVQGDAIPYGFKLGDDQKALIADADYIVWVGKELEPFMVEPVREAKKRGTLVQTVLDNTEIKVLPSRWADDGEDQARDPYFWLDSRNILILIDELTKELMSVDAQRAHLYRGNRAGLLARVAKLDRALEYGYRGLKGGIGISYFDTLQYFEQAYALKIRDVIAENPVQPVSAENLLQSRIRLREGYYSCLLVEQGLPMPELGILAEGAQTNIGIIDSFGTRLKAGPDFYFDLMSQNTTAIKKCLSYDTAEIEAEESIAGVSEPGKLGGKFMLTDHYGRLVTEKDMLGSFQLIYFGYTFCPDICPTSLQTMTHALELLGKDAKTFKPYFVTLDPERDDVKVMKNYVQYFNRDLVGLTGTLPMIERVAKYYNIRYEKVFPEDGKNPKLYNMDHTASIFLMAPNGDFVTKFAHGISAKQMVEGLKKYL